MSFEIIHSYTRRQAIEDGVLIDVSSTGKEAGITRPIALTQTLYETYVKPSKELEDVGQSVEGRLWDLLFIFAFYARRAKDQVFQYKCLFLMKPDGVAEIKRIKAHIGPGDDGEPVLTLMLPEED